jgi:hypothetical protein
MLVKPTIAELEQQFTNVDYHIFNAGELQANESIPGVVGKEAVSLNLE